jgi:LAO/AO transport system kinase
MDWDTLMDEMSSGSIPALSRLITHVEDRSPGWREVMRRLYPRVRHVPTVGITGYPGSGKSTLTGQLARELAGRGKSVGIIAIDPSSHLTGGAFLGDRIRMNALSGLEGVYIRSMGSRGAVGGIHPAARDVIKILDAFGKDTILVETVGVGQDEIDVTRAAQVVVLVCAPGQGDAIQYLKAGVMEMADIYVANKIDLPEAEKMLNNLRGMLMPGESGRHPHPPIVETQAEKGIGIAELADAIAKRVATGPSREAWRRRSAEEDVASLMRERLAELAAWPGTGAADVDGALEDLLAGRTDPYALADDILARSLVRMLEKHRS